ncbi:MAG: response regulator transcription factor [bacterium]
MQTSSEKCPLRVWIVEDNAAYRDVLTRVIRKTGDIACPLQFDSVEEALDALKSETFPEVILLDVDLPGMDGITAISHIKAAAPSCCIVMLTVFEDHAKVYRAICAGASGYLVKTSSSAQIVEAVRAAAEGGSPLSPVVARAVLGRFVELSDTPGKDEEPLSAREREVLEWMAQGLTKKEIASKLTMSEHTANNHLRNIYAKLHVNTRGAAVAKAFRQHLVG